MFGEEYNLTWSILNTTLGCEHDCELDIDHATNGFSKNDFWKAISGSNDCSNPTPYQIHNTTLCFLHYWMCITLFPGTRGRTLSDEELELLYAMICKIKVSPVKLLVDYCLNSIEHGKPIYFTSFITRIAESMGALEPHTIEYITSARDVLNEDFFIHINVLKRGPRGGLKMIYPGHTVEVSLPCEKCRLYALHTLTIKLDKEAQGQNVAGPRRVIRGMSQAAQIEQGGPSHPIGEEVEEGDDASSMDISGSMEMPPCL